MRKKSSSLSSLTPLPSSLSLFISIANASCAAREPRIQPMTIPTKSTTGMKMKCADVMLAKFMVVFCDSCADNELSSCSTFPSRRHISQT